MLNDVDIVSLNYFEILYYNETHNATIEKRNEIYVSIIENVFSEQKT